VHGPSTTAPTDSCGVQWQQIHSAAHPQQSARRGRGFIAVPRLVRSATGQLGRHQSARGLVSGVVSLARALPAFPRPAASSPAAPIARLAWGVVSTARAHGASAPLLLAEARRGLRSASRGSACFGGRLAVSPALIAAGGASGSRRAASSRSCAAGEL